MCGIVLCKMAGAAGRMQVAAATCTFIQAHHMVVAPRPRMLQQLIEAAGELCRIWLSCTLQEVAPENEDRSIWGTRCITAAQLGIQILNHPGTPLQATLPPPSHAIPQMGMLSHVSCSKLAVLHHARDLCMVFAFFTSATPALAGSICTSNCSCHLQAIDKPFEPTESSTSKQSRCCCLDVECLPKATGIQKLKDVTNNGTPE